MRFFAGKMWIKRSIVRKMDTTAYCHRGKDVARCSDIVHVGFHTEMSFRLWSADWSSMWMTSLPRAGLRKFRFWKVGRSKDLELLAA